MKKLHYLSFIFILMFYNCSQNSNKGTSTILSPESVINIAAVKKTKAKIVGEQKEVEISNEKINVWKIIYRDDKKNLHATVIKQFSDNKNKIGDSITIYYDSSNPISLPIYESQYLELTK